MLPVVLSSLSGGLVPTGVAPTQTAVTSSSTESKGTSVGAIVGGVVGGVVGVIIVFLLTLIFYRQKSRHGQNVTARSDLANEDRTPEKENFITQGPRSMSPSAHTTTWYSETEPPRGSDRVRFQSNSSEMMKVDRNRVALAQRAGAANGLSNSTMHVMNGADEDAYSNYPQIPTPHPYNDSANLSSRVQYDDGARRRAEDPPPANRSPGFNAHEIAREVAALIGIAGRTSGGQTQSKDPRAQLGTDSDLPRPTRQLPIPNMKSHSPETNALGLDSPILPRYERLDAAPST